MSAKKPRRIRITDRQTGESVERGIRPSKPRGPRTKDEAEEQRREAERRSQVGTGMVRVVGVRHAFVYDKGKRFAACNPSLRVHLDPTTETVTCKRCLRLNTQEGSGGY